MRNRRLITAKLGEIGMRYTGFEVEPCIFLQEYSSRRVEVDLIGNKLG
jgi:hypothetical protein